MAAVDHKADKIAVDSLYAKVTVLDNKVDDAFSDIRSIVARMELVHTEFVELEKQKTIL